MPAFFILEIFGLIMLLRKNSMEYSNSIKGVTADSLHGFFEGWISSPAPEDLLKILKNSEHVVIAKEDNRIIGFVTAISDGVLSTYIPLLEVLPEYRKKGVGSELVKRLLNELKGYYMIDLVCDDVLVPFYKKFGMKHASAMSLRAYQNRSGKL